MMAPPIPPIEHLVPHRAPMLLIHRVIAATENDVTAEARVDAGSIFAVDGAGIPSYVGLEMMAQTVCAYDGLQRFNERPSPLMGFLLGCRKYTVRRPYLAPGTVLTITARVLLHHGEMASFACRMSDGETATLAEGSLNVYRPANSEAYLRRSTP